MRNENSRISAEILKELAEDMGTLRKTFDRWTHNLHAIISVLARQYADEQNTRTHGDFTE
jgi:hypothetical protein